MNTTEGTRNMLPQLPENYRFATCEELDNLPKGAMITAKTNPRIWKPSFIENIAVSDHERSLYHYAVPNLYIIGDCVLKAERAVNTYITPIVPSVTDAPTEQTDLKAAISRMEAILPNHLACCFDTEHIFSLSALEKVKAAMIAVASEGQPPWNPEVGDIVCLKSGGPEMTVYNPNTSTGVHVKWFYDGQMKDEIFPKETLTFIRK